MGTGMGMGMEMKKKEGEAQGRRLLSPSSAVVRTFLRLWQILGEKFVYFYRHGRISGRSNQQHPKRARLFLSFETPPPGFCPLRSSIFQRAGAVLRSTLLICCLVRSNRGSTERGALHGFKNSTTSC